MARPMGANGARTAERVRQAALRLFASQGYAAVPMRQIAREVGIQASALYNHFPAKQDILVDLLRTHMDQLIHVWEWEMKELDGKTAGEKLAHFVACHIRFHVGRSDEVFLSYMELRNLEPDNFSRIEKLRHRYEGYLREILSEGARSGEFSIADIHVTTLAIISMLAGLNNWFRDGGRLGVNEITRLYIQLTAGALGIDVTDAERLANSMTLPTLAANRAAVGY